MKYTSRVQLLRDAADSIEMQNKRGIEPVAKHGSDNRILKTQFLDLYAG